MCVPDLFWDVQTCGLIGEGRRDWKVGLGFGVRMKQLITLIKSV